MQFTTKGRYALRVMLDIAQHDEGEYISIKEISQRQDITIKYMEQIMSLLNKAGFLKSFRGNTGGYKLARKPEEYTAGEVLRVVEGSLSPIACLNDNPNQCKRCKECLTLKFWTGLDKVIRDYIDSISLADLLPKK